MEVLECLSTVYQEVGEFIFNGATIVLPEMIHLFQCSDPSVKSIHSQLAQLSASINSPSKVTQPVQSYLFNSTVINRLVIQFNSYKQIRSETVINRLGFKQL